MARTTKPVLGEMIPPPRPTAAGALWLAVMLSGVAFVVLSLGEAIWRLAF